MHNSDRAEDDKNRPEDYCNTRANLMLQHKGGSPFYCEFIQFALVLSFFNTMGKRIVESLIQGDHFTSWFRTAQDKINFWRESIEIVQPPQGFPMMNLPQFK